MAGLDPVGTEKLTTELSRLKVGNTLTNSVSGDGASPVDSPTSLSDSLRDWLSGALESVASSTVANPRVYTKLLVSNAAAGSIIGKAGSNINSFQTQSFARMQLSKPEEYFPGTSERTLLITGRLKQVIAALGLVLEKLIRENVAPISPRYRAALQDPDSLESAAAASESENGGDSSSSTNEPRLIIKLLVPQPLCGIVIGKGGTNIKQCSNESATSIRLLNPDGPRMPLTHKIFLVSGTLENILKAVALLIIKQTQDVKFSSFSELQPSYLCVPPPAMASGPRIYPTPGAYGVQGVYYSPTLVATGAGGLVYEPNIAVAAGGAQLAGAPTGAVATTGSDDGNYYTTLPVALTEPQLALLASSMGSGMTQQVEHMTNTRIRLHRDSRRLIIKGVPEAVQMAHYVLNQRLAMMSMQSGYGGGYNNGFYAVQYGGGYPGQMMMHGNGASNGYDERRERNE